MPAPQQSVLIIEARYYDDIADVLVQGALAELERQGVSHERITVPGALEIPIALSIAIKNGLVGGAGRHHGCVALGCVIRGETSHYDIVAGESARALTCLATEHALPVGNGVLTVDSREQAWSRARAKGKNKGRDAAVACLSLMRIDQGQGVRAR